MLELLVGFVRFGTTLLRSDIGITQGSPLSPGLADMVLQAVEHRNGKTSRANWKLWMLTILRWVDDMLMITICLDTTKAGIDLRLRHRCSIEEFANTTLDNICDVYKQSGLH